MAFFQSLVLDFYDRTINFEKGEVMAEVKAFHLGLLSIVSLNDDEHQSFISKVDSMLSLNKGLQPFVGKFQRMLQHALTYKDFATELGMKKIKLTLAPEAEWEDNFTTEQAKVLEFKNQIDNTDREIDRMVHALYGLTEGEIRIVEE